MHILVFNCGSSSLTFKIFAATGGKVQATPLTGKAHRVGVQGTEPSFLEYQLDGAAERQVVALADHGAAARTVLQWLLARQVPVDMIGHRFVHGGSLFTDSAWVDDAALRRLEACVPLASLHNPISLQVIREARQAMPALPEYVTFDSAFHASIPWHLHTYALPAAVRQRFGFRRYGFHGLSYSYVTATAAQFLGRSPAATNLIACHLGTGGSSVAAIGAGRSLDTSMGYSPLPGLVMSTRSGDVDPMLAVYLMSVYGYSPEELDGLLNKRSGLLGLARVSSDLRDIIRQLEQGDAEAALAVDMYVHRLRCYVGAYAAELGRVDALVFTDDIGVRSPLVRARVCADMAWCGLAVDAGLNQAAVDRRLADIGASGAATRVLVVPTEEELIICLDGLRLVEARDASAG